MDLALHSLKAMRQLAPDVVPEECLQLYISNCIRCCSSLHATKYMQHRLVRLVCVFLQYLFINKLIVGKEIFFEIQAFCVEYIKIKEALSLYKTLKTFQGLEQ